jgi:hypothetical protein
MRQLKWHEVDVGLEEASIAQPPETAMQDVPEPLPENVAAPQNADRSLSVVGLIAETDLALAMRHAGWFLAWKPGTS